MDQNDYGLWKNAFFRIDLSARPLQIEDVKSLLVKTLIETRLSIDDLDELFVAIACKRGISEIDAGIMWNVLGRKIEENITNGEGNSEIDQKDADAVLARIPHLQHDILVLASDFIQECRKLIRLSTVFNKENTTYTMGVLGEIFAYLYARDVACYDCLHHKLVPDSIKTFRHGMDLLGVKFREEELDEVHFIEAKATSGIITSPRDDIVRWFRDELATKANTMIDQAKREWRNRYPDYVFLRAKKALSRFQVNLGELSHTSSRMLGSILIDHAQSPTDQEVLGFSRLNFPSKQLVIIKVPSMERLSVEVFELACKT